MRNTGRLVDVLDRMENGPVTDEKDFDMGIIAGRTAQLVKEYNIKFDGENVVNCDDDMADRCFQAGLALAVEAGVLCKSNGRRLLWTRREIEDLIKYAPNSMTLGYGRDAHTDRHRFPEDIQPPTILGGSIGIPVSEELFIPLTQSYIQEPIVDAIINSTLVSVYGRDIRTSSPWEILGAWHEAEMTITAARRVGREGISVGCVATAPSDIAELSASSFGGFRKTDWHMIAMISELKTNYDLLNKVTHLVRTDSIIHCYYNPIYGGLAGSAEGMAVLAVAGLIMLHVTYMSPSISTSPTHPFYANNTTPEIIWGISLFTQALSRNTPFLQAVATTCVGGPGTKTLLYESAASAITATVSGATRLMGPRPSAGTALGHASGLEARFFGEVGHAAKGMSREHANEIVKQIIPKYKDLFDKDPKGQRFDEVYDLHTLKPTTEWLATYDEVKAELGELGMSF